MARLTSPFAIAADTERQKRLARLAPADRQRLSALESQRDAVVAARLADQAARRPQDLQHALRTITQQHPVLRYVPPWAMNNQSRRQLERRAEELVARQNGREIAAACRPLDMAIAALHRKVDRPQELGRAFARPRDGHLRRTFGRRAPVQARER